MRYADNFCTYKEQFKPEHAYVFTGPCVFSEGETHTVVVPAKQLFQYRRGAKMQDAFPDMDPNDREFLMSGISPKAFDEEFAEDVNIDDLSEIELGDGGCIEPPESDSGTIRRRDKDGNCEEIRNIDDPDWTEWADMFGVNESHFQKECEECGRTKKNFMLDSGTSLDEIFGCPECDDKEFPETD